MECKPFKMETGTPVLSIVLFRWWFWTVFCLLVAKNQSSRLKVISSFLSNNVKINEIKWLDLYILVKGHQKKHIYQPWIDESWKWNLNLWLAFVVTDYWRFPTFYSIIPYIDLSLKLINRMKHLMREFFHVRVGSSWSMSECYMYWSDHRWQVEFDYYF